MIHGYRGNFKKTFHNQTKNVLKLSPQWFLMFSLMKINKLRIVQENLCQLDDEKFLLFEN